MNNLAVIEQIERRYQRELANLPDTEREFLELTRNLNLAQEIYVMLAKRFEEAKVAEVSTANEISIVDELHKFFGKNLNENCEINDCLRGEKTFSDALTLTGVENLSLIIKLGNQTKDLPVMMNPFDEKIMSLFTPEEMRRQSVYPGLTGIAQISGRNN